MNNLKFKIALKIVKLLGYKNLVSQQEGFIFFVGDKYLDKGWHTVSLKFNNTSPIAKEFTGQLDSVKLFSKKLNKKEIERMYKLG